MSEFALKKLFFQFFDTDTNENIMNVYFCQDTTGAIHYSSLSMDSARKEAGLDSLSLYSGISGISSNKNIIISGPVQLAKSFACDFSWMDSKGKAFALSGAKVIIKTNSGKSLKKSRMITGWLILNLSKTIKCWAGEKNIYLRCGQKYKTEITRFMFC